MPHAIFEALRIIYLIVLVGACGYAALCGGRDERRGAFIQFSTSLASLPAVALTGRMGWHDGQVYLLLVDLITLAAFLALALTTKRFWPLWATGFHFNAVLTHIAKLVAPATIPAGYALLQGFWAYPLMIAMIVGTVSHHREARRGIRGDGAETRSE